MSVCIPCYTIRKLSVPLVTRKNSLSLTLSCFREDLAELSVTDSEFSYAPMDIHQLREEAMKKIAKKEAAGLLNQPLFGQDKKGKPRPKAKIK